MHSFPICTYHYYTSPFFFINLEHSQNVQDSQSSECEGATTTSRQCRSIVMAQEMAFLLKLKCTIKFSTT